MLIVRLGSTLLAVFSTSDFSDGAALDADSTPTVSTISAVPSTLTTHTTAWDVSRLDDGLYAAQLEVQQNVFGVHDVCFSWIEATVGGTLARAPLPGYAAFTIGNVIEGLDLMYPTSHARFKAMTGGYGVVDHGWLLGRAAGGDRSLYHEADCLFRNTSETIDTLSAQVMAGVSGDSGYGVENTRNAGMLNESDCSYKISCETGGDALSTAVRYDPGAHDLLVFFSFKFSSQVADFGLVASIDSSGKGWEIYYDQTDDLFIFRASADGSTFDTVQTSTGAVEVDRWYIAIAYINRDNGGSPTMNIVFMDIGSGSFDDEGSAAATHTYTAATSVLLIGKNPKHSGPTHDAWMGCLYVSKTQGCATGLEANVDTVLETARLYLMDMPAAGAGTVDANVVAWKGGTVPAVSVTGVPIVDTKYFNGTILPTPSVAGIPRVEDATLQSRLTSTRAGYLDNLNAGGVVASHADVTAIQNNTRAVIPTPDNIIVPPSSTRTYVIELFLYDESGNMEAPDSAPTIALANQAGTDRSGRLDSTTMAVVGSDVGHYKAVYTSTSTDTEEQVNWTFSVVEGGVTRKYGRTSAVGPESVGVVDANVVSIDGGVLTDIGAAALAAIQAWSHDTDATFAGLMVRLESFIGGKFDTTGSGTTKHRKFYKRDGSTVAFDGDVDNSTASRGTSDISGSE